MNKWPEEFQCPDHPNNDQTCPGCALARQSISIIDSCRSALLEAVSVERLHKIISASTLGNYAANYEWTMMLADELREFILSDLGIKEEDQ